MEKNVYGYARVSTDEQDLSLQINDLKKAGCTKIFTDKVSGAKAERKGLNDCLAALKSGDALLVWRIDRLGRSLAHLVSVVTDLKERGVGFKSLMDGAIDTTTASGELVFNIFGSFAQFERRLIQERTKAGLAAARARGRCGGRRQIAEDDKRVVMVTEDQEKLLQSILADDGKKGFKHQMVVLVAPRRHSKSTLFALIVLWLTCARKNHVVQLLGSNQFHSLKTQLQLCRNIIENTPALKLFFSPIEKNLLNNELKCPKNKSVIQMLSGTSTASSFGQKIDCLWVSDLHSAVDLQPWYNLQANSPVLERLPFKSIKGNTYTRRIEDSLSSVGSRALNTDYTDKGAKKNERIYQYGYSYQWPPR